MLYEKAPAIFIPYKTEVKVTQSCLTLRTHGVCSPWNSPGQNTGVGSLSLLQGIFPTQGLNPGLPQYKWILYQLSHQGNPRTLEWVIYPFSSRSSRPRGRTRVSCIAGGFFTSWAIREAPSQIIRYQIPEAGDLSHTSTLGFGVDEQSTHHYDE